jgi:hypothetical protein
MIKDLLGALPYTAELYWRFRQRGQKTTVRLNLSRLQGVLPGWVETAQAARQTTTGRKVLVFGMISYWIEHTTLLSLALAGLGHTVTLAVMPYAHWKKPIGRFDLRRQNAYLLDTLAPAQELLELVSILDVKSSPLPAELDEKMRQRAYRDTQYAMLTEEIDPESDLFHLRLARNREAAGKALAYLQSQRPDVVITPNGSILEFGVLFEVARYLQIPVSTFEFGEQNYRMWLAQNDDVMLQDTTPLWEARQATPLEDAEWERIRAMFASRQGGEQWETFARQWQRAPSQGGEQARQTHSLDERPLAFLPTNVLGDSLTLGRDVFTGMTHWIRETIRWFGQHPQYQLVIRIHPGEGIGWGPSTYDLLAESFATFPENVTVFPADAEVNSYDFADAAAVGLVYTTTMGLEMAMRGMPVLVTGQTHYRGKGFTQDPDSLDDFFLRLEQILLNPDQHQPDEAAVQTAWTYAYRFFFEYPQPFPWHIQYFWECEAEWPLERVLGEEGQAEFESTFEAITHGRDLFGVKVRRLEGLSR